MIEERMVPSMECTYVPRMVLGMKFTYVPVLICSLRTLSGPGAVVVTVELPWYGESAVIFAVCLAAPGPAH